VNANDAARRLATAHAGSTVGHPAPYPRCGRPGPRHKPLPHGRNRGAAVIGTSGWQGGLSAWL